MELGDIDQAIVELPNFEDETCLLDIKIDKDKCNKQRKNFRLLITDYNIILTTKENTYEEEESFLIKEIEYVVRTIKKKKMFIMKVKNKPTFFFSCKKADEAIEMLKSLYQN